MRRKGVRRVVVAVVLAAVMVAGRAQPAGAFLSSLDPAGWAVVAQMAAIISQAIAIKRQVENVRNQARAEFFGKLAPLSGKLAVVAGRLRNARTQAGVCVYDPLNCSLGHTPGSHVALLPSSVPVFNRPMDLCAGGVSPTDPCMPATRTLPVAMPGSLAAAARGSMLSSGGVSPITRAYTGADADIAAGIGVMEARMRHGIDRADRAIERNEQKRALRRALVEEQMAIVEDWRGCQEAVPGSWTPPPGTTDDRIPCVTNDGLGREEPGVGRGTTGIQEGLVSKLDALQAYQDGDVSKVQLDTMQTELIVMLGRIQAAGLEREAAELAERQDARMVAEAARRRMVELQQLSADCKVANGPYSYFVERAPITIPPSGSCRVVTDASVASLAALRSSCLLAGQCV